VVHGHICDKFAEADYEKRLRPDRYTTTNC